MRLILVAAIALAGAAHAQQPASCPSMDASLPAGFQGWKSPVFLTPAHAAAQATMAALRPGQAAVSDLPRSRDVKFVVEPEKPPPPASYAGLYSVQIDRPGDYSIGISGGGWIDVVRDGKVIESKEHGHGPECSTVRKAVVFALQPGRYTIQISSNPDPRMTILVTPKS